MGDRLRVEDISGGIRQDMPMVTMPPNTWLSLVNMEYDETDKLKKRAGQTLYNGAAIVGTLDNGIRFSKNSDTSLSLVISADDGATTKVYKGNDGAGTFAEVTSGGTLSTGWPVCFHVFRDTLFMANGHQTMKYMSTGTSKVQCVFSDNDRKGAYISSVANRLVMGGDPSAKLRLYLSEDGLFTVGPGTDCSFPNDNYIDLADASQGDYITGLLKFRDNLFVGTSKTWYRILAPESLATIYVQEVQTAEGLVNSRACCATPYGIFFVSPSKTIWFWNPDGGNPQNVGTYNQTTLNAATITNAVACYYPAKKQVYVSFKQTSSSTYNDYSIVYDLKKMDQGVLRSAEASNMGASAFVSFDAVGDTGAIYRLTAETGAGTKGFVYKMDVGAQDNAVNYAWTAYSKHFSMEDAETRKYLRKVRLAMKADTSSTPATATISVDRGNGVYALGTYTVKGFAAWGSFVYGTAPYGGGNYQTATLSVPHATQGKEIQLQLTKTDANTFTLHGYSFEYINRALLGV